MLFREKNYVRVLLCLIVTFFLQSSVFALDREAVKWSELGEHLIINSVTIESMPVVDCPLGIESESAEHLVCQVIENTFYKWKEYEFYNAAGEAQLAIEMIKPEASFLSAAEALILLNGSKLCERQPLGLPDSLVECPCPVDHRKTKNPVPINPQVYEGTMPLEVSVSSLEDPIANMVPRLVSVMEVDDEATTLESIHGTDDRNRVAGSTGNLTYPTNNMCYISTYVEGDGYYRGSGALVSPRCVLTAGHNVYDQTLSVYATEVEVAASQYQYFEGGTVNRPYGTVNYSSVHTNNNYIAGLGTGEYDYGMVKLEESFPGISTFMPLEYDYYPTPGIITVNSVGYPGAGPGESESFSMWHDYDLIVGYQGIDDRIMLHMVDTSPGQSGSPIWTFDGTTNRLVAIHIFGSSVANGACRLVSANEPVISEWMEDSLSYDNFAYIPYLSTNSTVARWTGVALANRNGASNSVKVDYYNNSGSHLGTVTKTIGANGQTSFGADTADGTEGWIKISSTAPLNGLALIGDSFPQSMFDIDLKSSLHQEFLFPHLAASSDWNSIAMICNPNSASATITYKYYNCDGSYIATRSSTIPANGSVQKDLYTLFQRELEGSVVIQSSRPVTVFLLYDNSHTTWRAGLSAIPLD